MPNLIDRIQRLQQHHVLQAGLAEPRTRQLVINDLKKFYKKLPEYNPEIGARITKALVHGLADSETTDTDARVFQGLLALHPELSAPHLIGGLIIEGKKDPKAKRRVRISTDLLSKKRFATKAIQRMLVAGLDNDSESKKAALREILIHKNHANVETSNFLIGALRSPESATVAREILKDPAYAFQQTANNLIAALKIQQGSREASELLLEPQFATFRTGAMLISSLRVPELFDKSTDALTNPVYVNEENLHRLLPALQDPEQSKGAIWVLLHSSYANHPALLPAMIQELLFGIDSRNEYLAGRCEEVLAQLARIDKARDVMHSILKKKTMVYRFDGQMRKMQLTKSKEDFLKILLQKIMVKIKTKDYAK